MKARMIVILLVLAMLVPLNVPLARASVEPIYAVDSFFTALNAGNHQAAVAAFTPDAVATLVRGETYRGPDGMLQLVQRLDHAERHYEVVQATMVGDTVTFVVEVSDHGIRWGQETIVAEVRAGKLHTLHETALVLRLGS